MSYQASLRDDAVAFLDQCESWLREREDVENLILSLAYALRGGARDDTLYLAVLHDDEVVGCALRTPPHKLLVTDLPEDSAPPVVRAVAERSVTLPAVLGPESSAAAVARAWSDLKGGEVRPGLPQRIYRLDVVVPPRPTEGEMRPARPDDLEVGVAWGRGFARDAGTQFDIGRPRVEEWIRLGYLYLWEVDGTARSIAVAGGRTPRGVRIGYVYTPPEERGKGYASALVGALSQHMLDAGFEFCVLYTDRSNPTSNAIYRRLGYERIRDVRDFDLVPPEEG